MDPRELVLLTDKVAVVTGGGGGLGRAIAIGLASAGADVVVADIVPERCDETVARIQELGRRGLGVPTNVMETAQVRALIARVEEEFGRLDILVNNAGGVNLRPFLEQSENSWRRHIDLNLVSMLTAVSAAVPVMIKGGRGGSIINVTSIEAERAAPGAAVYSACKAGMNNFTRTMALELGEHGIRINAIAPDYTDTPGTRGNPPNGPVDPSTWFQWTPAQKDAMARRFALKRAGIDTEIGNAAIYLASELSSYVTGTILPVDGGAWAGGGWHRSKSGKWVMVDPE